MKKKSFIPWLNLDSEVTFGGLMTMSLACLAMLAGESDIDLPITVGIHCFAIAIPCLAFCTERARIDALYELPIHSVGADLIKACGILGSLLGFGAIFWHFSIPAAVTFGTLCVVGSVFHGRYTQALEKVKREATQPDGASAAVPPDRSTSEASRDSW